MTTPDRSSLLADVRRPTITVAFYSGTMWVDVSPHVISATVQASLPDVLSFGAGPIPSAQVTLGPDAHAYTPAFAPIRITYSLHSFPSGFRVFVGYVLRSERTPTEVVWSCSGIGDMIAAQAIRIPVRRSRPAHTQTTTTSIEDPNNPSYRGGIINELLWKAGGRPLEQQSTYPDAPWYYTCSHSLLTPAWSWLDGENAWEDAGRLCRAVGSLIYQDGDGIVRCRSVIHAITGPVTFGWTDAPLTQAERVVQNQHGYQAIQEQRSYYDVPTTITVRYTRRAVSAVRELYKDTIARVVAPSGTLSVSLTLQEPLVTLSRVNVDAADLPTGAQRTPAIVITTAQAQTIVLAITNPSTSTALLVTGIRVYGTCIEAIEQNEVRHTASSATTVIPRELRTEDNPYVQDEQHAVSLALLLQTVYGQVRPVCSLRGCPSDPERRIGEIVRITSQHLGLIDTRALITDIQHQDNSFMDVECVLLPDIDDATMYYIVDEAYTASSVRRVGW